MPRASKKCRVHKKPRLGSSSANTETTGKGKQIADASVNPGRRVEQTGPFANLPVDVFLEIAAYCRPLDLLHLCRVSTKLRAVVLAKRNRSVWVCARNSLSPPMPACPDDLSEPKYASLVFDRFCVVCGTTPLWVDYAARIRLCEQCWKIHVKAGYTIIRELEPQIRRDRSLKRVIFDLLPEASNVGYYYAIPDVVHQTPLLDFYQPQVAAAVKEYYTVVQSSGGDSRVLEEYVERRKARTLERLKFHSAVRRWSRDHARAQEAARTARFISAIDNVTRMVMETLLKLESTV